MAGLRDNRYDMHRSTAILVLATAALAATTLWSWRAFVAERDRADALQSDIEQREPLLPAAALDLAAGIACEMNEADVPGSTETKPSATKDEIFGRQRRLLQNESYRDARRRVRTLELARGHIDLAKVMGISQQQADRLIALLVDRELQYMDRPQRNPRNEKELQIRHMEIQQSQQEEDDAIAALIGAGNLPKWKQYQSSLPVRHDVYQLGAGLYTQAEPLRAEQIERLTSVIHSERQRVRQQLIEFTESLVWSGGMEGQSHIDRDARQAELTRAADARIHAAASAFLSAKQLEALDDRMRREREMQEAEFQEKRAMIESDRVNGDEANSIARQFRQP